MKITHNKVGQNLNMTDSTKSSSQSARAGQTKAAGDDKNSLLEALDKKPSQDGSAKVNLSQRAQDIQRAKELAKAAPDVREDRVAALQKLIDEGKYKVDAKEIADKMVDEEMQWT